MEKQGLARLIEALEKRGLWANLATEEDKYLLRFGRPDTETWLLLMYDHGITWEPARAYPTPCYCMVDPDDVDTTADKMARVLAAYETGALPYDAEAGEGAASDL